MTASMTPTDEEGSSSIEPITWGRIESSKERERMEDLRRWESINVGGYASQRTTKVYRHGRCYMCSKPVSSTNLDPNVELFCKECDEDLTALDCGYSPSNQADKPTKKRLEKVERDDEEEWGRIPIPLSDDESEGETWLDESDDSAQECNNRSACIVSVETAFGRQPTMETNERKVNRSTTDDFAFRHGPRRDGTILMKDGSILNIYNLNPLENLKPEKPKFEQELPEANPRPQWTSTLLSVQRVQLRMGYKSKTKLRARIMRQIKVTAKKVVKPSRMQRTLATKHVNMRLQGWSENNKPVYRPELNDSPTTKEGDEKEESQTKPTSITIPKLQTLCQLATGQYTQYDTIQGYINEKDTYGRSTMHQCVNAFHQPPKPKKEKGLKLRIKVAVQKPKRRKLNFQTVTVITRNTRRTKRHA